MHTSIRRSLLVLLPPFCVATAAAQELGSAPYLNPSMAPPLLASPKAAFVPSINTQHRGEVVAAFFARLLPGDAVPMQWSGSVPGCNAGSTSATYAQATIDRVNYYRAMAGVPDNVTLSSSLSSDDQVGALMFSANNQLSHTPPTTWNCYNGQGARGAGNSNIALGGAGPDAIDLYMDDFGSNNAIAGHRRWILYPRQTSMGTGSVDRANGYLPANALWVLDTASWTTPPSLPNGTAWPSPGYFPYLLLPSQEKRWSYSLTNADFSAASVSVTKSGVSLNVIQEAIATGYGDNTLVWRMPDVQATAPTADTTYNVTINNVMVGGSPRTVSYAVTVINVNKPPELRDFLAKGKADIVWRQTSTGQHVAWMMNGTTSVSAFALGGDPAWNLAAIGDLNRDGYADVLWEEKQSGAVVAKLMRGNTVVSSGGIGGGGGWRLWATGDFNGDGKIDVVWRQTTTGATAIALMNGTAVTSQTVVGGSTDFSIAETGDFDGDGRTDIVWRQQSTGNLLIQFMNGTTVTGTAFVTSESSGWKLVGTADLDGDGKSDLIFRNASSGMTVVWYMNGPTASGSTALGGDTTWTLHATGDFNGDGKVDLLWRDSSSGAVVMWLMNGSSAISSTYLGGSADWVPITQ